MNIEIHKEYNKGIRLHVIKFCPDNFLGDL
jgi:hypothetical protein